MEMTRLVLFRQQMCFLVEIDQLHVYVPLCCLVLNHKSKVNLLLLDTSLCSTNHNGPSREKL